MMPRLPTNVQYNNPITAGHAPQPGRIAGMQTSLPQQGMLPQPPAAKSALGQQLGQYLRGANQADQVSFNRQAAPMMAQLENQRQAAVENQGLSSAAFGANRYAASLANNLQNQQLGLGDARLGLGDARLNFGDRALSSQAMRTNAGLTNQRLGQMQGMLPWLLQYFG